MKTATILAIIGLTMAPVGGGAAWTHYHGSKTILANKADIRTLVSINESQKEISKLEAFMDKLHILRGNFRNRLFEAEMVPDPDIRILEIRNQLELEVEGYDRLLEQQRQRIRDEQQRESKLLERLHTA